jgi:DNA helicase HerA-like ATPase
VTGIPTAKPPDETDGAFAIDRLIRAMAKTRWAVLVLAQPIPERWTREVLGQVLNEMRASQTAYQAAAVPSPLAEHYDQLLRAALGELTNAQTVGAWRTAAYLLGVPESYYRLAGAFRSIFAGEASLPEPLRVRRFEQASWLAAAWAMPNDPEQPGPGLYQHLFRYQTLLSSAQLAAYVHLPQLETSGFSVRVVPDFDVVPMAVPSGRSVSLGKVLQRGRATDAVYAVDLDSLAGHAFVSGVTGQGKTNTIFHLLRQAADASVPFLVVEPAKAEYRALQSSTDLRIFTVGDERISPLRMNPFEVLPGASVGMHLDLLRSVFAASFGDMWSPLPQVLEQCLAEVFQDRGWDIETSRNLRGGEATPEAFPTLSDLAAKVEEVTKRFGFDPEAEGRVLGSLKARINGLRVGGKGRMLDTVQSVPIQELLEANTVLELDGMGDDDDKAFVMGLLFIRLVEYRRAQEEARRQKTSNGDRGMGLQHLLVIEEAHRLLTNIPRSPNVEQSDPRGKAVETFANLLSEIRAYGQGVIVADQIASRLAPDVIKNTNLKLTHRVVAGDDRELLGQAMVMNNRQVEALASLTRGHAAVFAQGDDAPLLVEVPNIKDKVASSIPGDARVRQTMADSPFRHRYRALFRPTPACEGSCPEDEEDACSTAQRLTDDPAVRQAVARLILSVIEDNDALERGWADIRTLLLARRPPNIPEAELERCFAIRAGRWLARHRGAQAGWSYAATESFEQATGGALLAAAQQGGPAAEAIGALRDVALSLHRRDYEPYPICSAVCTQQPAPLCLYRQAAADLLQDREVVEAFLEKDVEDTERIPKDDRRNRTWEASQDAAYRLIDYPGRQPTPPAWRASLCFAQQVLARDGMRSPITVHKILQDLYREASNERTEHGRPPEPQRA